VQGNGQVKTLGTLLALTGVILAAAPLGAQVSITPGSGSFSFIAGQGGLNHTIDVFYFRPDNFTPSSPILIVMAGGGRNGDDYRDAWIESARNYGVLVLSPSYTEDLYPRSVNYNLARMIATTVDEPVVRDDPEEWLFRDVDRLFDVARAATGSERTTYDFFGHSAGGQIGHRMALFHPESGASRIVAANSGWYTAAHFGQKFPYGLDGAPVTESRLADAYASHLLILLGELDNADETRGDLRRTPEANVQGAHRLERGRYFYRTARAEARARETEFGWEMVVVPGVGHSYREMSVAAAEYLYGSS
jgi:pimeloyl-ACP methyl ester carboxylesterase